MHVRKGDTVVITTGKDRGMDGEVLAVDRKHGRVKVARRNMIIKHRKPNPLTGDEGARIEKEGWIDASNVSLKSMETGGPIRTGKRFVGADDELFENRQDAVASFGDDVPERIAKVRYANKTGEVFDEV